ncbi:uncharacterized protein LOC116706697 [Etheostoma spectabile]|uniref:uncharacterized protein LOC116706697 n=1 Tax=Etheostoma spectabile TaxID=54343 RepID=UPI0013AEFD4B|nr:uncharacterized protein LOC116706697 [Etheostoma spectabile]
MRGAALSGLVVVLLTAPVIQSQNGWGVTYSSTPICALKGSTVEIRCSYTYPSTTGDVVKERFWFTKESNDVYVDLTTDPEYSGRVQYDCKPNYCTLRISDLRESDSAVYKFRFTTNQDGGRYTGSPGVTLSVTGLQVQVIGFYSNWAMLKCQSSCHLPDQPSYVWYNNGQNIQGQTSDSYLPYINSADSYSCAVRGHENSSSPSVSMRGESGWGVTYTSTKMCALKRATVEMHCSYRYPSTTVKERFWFTKENNVYADLTRDPEYSDRVHHDCKNNNCTLRISELGESDSAEYKFRFITYQEGGRYTGRPGVTLTVADPQLQVHVRTSRVGSHQQPVWAELTCHNKCPLPNQYYYIWYKNGQEVEDKKLNPITTSYFHLDVFNPADNYSCAVLGYEMFPSPPVYGPKRPSVSVSPSAEIVEGRSVTLTCSSDANPAAKYTWYKENGSPDLQRLSEGPQLVFSSVLSSKSGQYSCTAENKLGRRTSANVSINVKYAPKLVSVSVSPSAEIVEGSSVTLTCSSDANPAANYTWYKENQTLLHGPEGKYYFTSISFKDRGNYYCKSENQYGLINSSTLSIDVQYGPKRPSVSVSPSAEIVEGSSVNLTCSSDANPAANYTWYKENGDSPKASGQIFTIPDVRPEHSGDYSVKPGTEEDVRISAINLGTWKSVIIGTIPAVILIVVCLSVFLLIRKKRTSKHLAKPGDGSDNREQSEERDELHYASIHFSQNQTDPVYCNIRPAGLRRHEEQEEEDEDDRVEYSAVKFNSARTPPRTRVKPHKDERSSYEFNSSERFCCLPSLCARSSTADVTAGGCQGRWLAPRPVHLHRPRCELAGAISRLTYKRLMQGQNWKVTYNPPETCVLKGSTVEISCTYRYPSRINGRDTAVEKTIWFTRVSGREPVDLRADSEYSGRVQYHCGKNSCTLTISDLRERDSAEYKFMFTTNQPGGSFAGEPGVPLSVTDPDLRVGVKPIVHQGYTKAELRCHSACRLPDHPSYIWYKKGQEIEAETASFTISFEWSDSFSCALKGREDFPSPPVYPDMQVHVHVRSKWFSSWPELKCHSRCRLPGHPSYVWYKNGQKVQKKTSDSYSASFDPADSFSCAVRGHEDFPSPSVCVQGESCNRVTYTDRSICVPRDSSVDISCTYNSYQDQVESKFWFSPERNRGQNPSQPGDLSKDPQYSGRVQVETERGRSTLRISDLRESDSAEYHFKFITPSFEWRSSLPGTTLTVTALRVKVSRKLVYHTYTYAELTCHSSCSPADLRSYVWFKNGRRITKEQSSSYKDRFYLGDIISCALKGHDNYRSLPIYALKIPSVSVSPSGEVMEGSSVTLTCSSDAYPAATYTWYLEKQKLLNKEPQLVFSTILSSDSGEYYCAAENELGKRTSEPIFINVKYGPKRPSVSVSPSAEIVEGSSVNLTCSSDANPAANYTWYKENQTLASPLHGPEDICYFPSISSNYRGNYHCKSENQHGELSYKSVFIDVQYGPKHPSVSVSPSAEIVEGSSVTLTCSSDANPAANYTWYKENEDSPKASGQIFTITDVRPEHSGDYSCEAQNRRGRQSSTLHLIVVAGAWKSSAVGTSTAAVLAVILLSVFMLARKRRASKQSPEPKEKPKPREQYLTTQRALASGLEDIHYASVQFSKKQPDSLYIRPARLHRREEGDSVVYAAVTV